MQVIAASRYRTKLLVPATLGKISLDLGFLRLPLQSFLDDKEFLVAKGCDSADCSTCEKEEKKHHLA